MGRTRYGLKRQRELTLVRGGSFFGRLGRGCGGWIFGNRFRLWFGGSYFFLRDLVFPSGYIVAMRENLVGEVQLFRFFFDRLALFDVLRIYLGRRFRIRVFGPDIVLVPVPGGFILRRAGVRRLGSRRACFRCGMAILSEGLSRKDHYLAPLSGRALWFGPIHRRWFTGCSLLNGRCGFARLGVLVFRESAAALLSAAGSPASSISSKPLAFSRAFRASCLLGYSRFWFALGCVFFRRNWFGERSFRRC